MKHWLQLAPGNWWARPGRTAGSVLAIALGVGMVVWITCAYESVRLTVTDWVWEWVGRSHLTVESPLGKWGSFDRAVADEVRALPNVQRVTSRLWWRVFAARSDTTSTQPTAYDPNDNRLDIEINGIEPETEYAFRELPRDVLPGGRALEPGDHQKIVVEKALADEMGLDVGDTMLLSVDPTAVTGDPYELVGIIERRRISRFQHPAAWITLDDALPLIKRPTEVTAVDVVLKDPDLDNLERYRAKIQKIATAHHPQVKVDTAEAKLRQLENAMGQLEMILALISCVAFMTSFFIILSTLSMGMIERLRYLGLLRCIGLTRWQLMLLVPAEILPLGVVGVLLGVPIGFGLTLLTVRLVPEYIGRWSVSEWGLWLACGGGIATALFAAIMPAIDVLRVSPLAATKPEARKHPRGFEALAAGVGLVLIAAHYIGMHQMPADSDAFAPIAVVGLLMLYIGYALVIPAIILLTGPIWVRLVAKILGLQWRLLRDQVTQAAWRSAAICAGLMVGLSLMVALWVHSEGILEGWQFPKKFPEAYLYAFNTQPEETAKALADVEGVASFMCVNEFPCEVDPDDQRGGIFKWLRPAQRFVSVEPSQIPALVQLEYLQGDEATALAQLEAGGHVLLTREFSRTYAKELGDEVVIRVGEITETFIVAGVVASPAIDIAVSFFGATGELQFFSVGSVIGTFADASERFGRSGFRMLLFNFDIPAEDGGEAATPHKNSNGQANNLLPVEAGDRSDQDMAYIGAQSEREEEVFTQIVAVLRARRPSVRAVYGSVRVLKHLIDREFRKVTKILTAIPVMSLIVAAVGVANLMTANVSARQRQIAIMRAVGATRWQMIRLVMGEAIILGAIGSVMGILLGLHLAANSNYVTAKVFGFEPVWTIPWGWVSAAVAITSAACLIAGIAPARHAARNNIVSAMQAT